MIFFKKIICLFIPNAKIRHRILRNDRSLIRVIENNRERLPHWYELRRVFVSQGKNLKGNVVKIQLPNHKIRLKIDFCSNNNCITIDSGCRGTMEVVCQDDDGFVMVGEKTNLGNCFVSTTGSGVKIGKNCLFSSEIILYAGDAHTLFDQKTGKVLNAHSHPIVIGDHCWIGKGATFTKNAVIPNNTVVGLKAVVTKKFTEEYTALAGCPAKVVHTSLGWDSATPDQYIHRQKGKKK